MTPVLTSDGVMSTLRNLTMIPDSLVFTSLGLQRSAKAFLEQGFWRLSVSLHKTDLCLSADMCQLPIKALGLKD